LVSVDVGERPIGGFHGAPPPRPHAPLQALVRLPRMNRKKLGWRSPSPVPAFLPIQAARHSAGIVAPTSVPRATWWPMARNTLPCLFLGAASFRAALAFPRPAPVAETIRRSGVSATSPGSSAESRWSGGVIPRLGLFPQTASRPELFRGAGRRHFSFRPLPAPTTARRRTGTAK